MDGKKGKPRRTNTIRSQVRAPETEGIMEIASKYSCKRKTRKTISTERDKPSGSSNPGGGFAGTCGEKTFFIMKFSEKNENGE
jgi:hypothetical protein